MCVHCCAVVQRGAVTQVDMGKYSPGQTQQAFLAESSVAEEQRTQLKGCAGVGRRGSFLAALRIFVTLCFIWKQHLQFSTQPFLWSPARLWLAPQQIRGPSVSDSSVRLSELFVLLFPAVKTVSHCLCYCLYLGFWADSLCSPATGYIAWSSCQFGNSC